MEFHRQCQTCLTARNYRLDDWHSTLLHDTFGPHGSGPVADRVASVFAVAQKG